MTATGLPTRKTNSAFSLIEILVVISIIGILAAIAMPSFSQVYENSRERKNRRNAQSIAAIFNSAQTAGAIYTPNDLATATNVEVAKKVAAFYATPRRGAGVNDTSYFNVSMQEGEASAAGPYLNYHSTSKTLVYTAGGDGL